MTADERDRAIEYALTILVISVVITAVVGALGSVGGSMHHWLRERGHSLQEISLMTVLWSWIWTFQLGASVGFIVGLWRLARALEGGRAQLLLRIAAGSLVAALLLGQAWRILFPLVMRGVERGSIQTIASVAGLVNAGTHVLGAALAFVALAELGRAMGGATWGRAVVATLGVVVDLAWTYFGFLLVEDSALRGLAGVATEGVRAACVLALLLPLRGAWRASFAARSPSEGPYRTPERPREAWRSAPELQIAGAGLAQVRRRLLALAALTVVAMGAGFAVVNQRMEVVAGATFLVGLAQLPFFVSLVAGTARFTRAPFELHGRSLAVAALICAIGSLVSSTKILVGAGAIMLEIEPLYMLASSDGVGFAVAGLASSLLLAGAVARAAGALGARNVRRRAFAALATSVAIVAGGVFFGVTVGVSELRGGFGMLAVAVFVAPLAALINVGVYVWMLSGASAMMTSGPKEESPA